MSMKVITHTDPLLIFLKFRFQNQAKMKLVVLSLTYITVHNSKV